MRQHPRGLIKGLFEPIIKTTPNTATDTNLRILSDGLRMFANGILVLEGADATAHLFQRAAADVERASDQLRMHGSAANERGMAAARFLQGPLQERLGIMVVDMSGEVCLCVFELHTALLREREVLRVYRGTDMAPDLVSDGYSRMGDILSFMAGREDIVACIEAHRIIETGYAMAASLTPRLHFRHRRPRVGCFRCAFDNIWCRDDNNSDDAS
jgi:hypothetical protein